MTKEDNPDPGRRRALDRFGLATGLAYVTPGMLQRRAAHVSGAGGGGSGAGGSGGSGGSGASGPSGCGRDGFGRGAMRGVRNDVRSALRGLGVID